MNNNKLSFLTISIAIILLVVGFSFEFLNGYKVDAQEMDFSRQIIDRNYRHLNNEMYVLADLFESADFVQAKYYQEVYDNNAKYLSEMASVNKKMINLKNLSNLVLQECEKMPSIDRDINSKCEVIRKNYELVHNTYISLVDIFNEEVVLCNQWLEDNALTVRAKQFENLDFIHYIDLDQDGQTNGKF